MTDPVETLRAYEQRMHDLTTRADAPRVRRAALRPAVTSPDGAVTVTVSAVGALLDLSFGPAAESLELPDLARLVVSTAQTARAEAARQAEARVAELVGPEAAHRAMEPPPSTGTDDDDDAPGYRGRGF